MSDQPPTLPPAPVPDESVTLLHPPRSAEAAADGERAV
jgi:hypothetical protein